MKVLKLTALALGVAAAFPVVAADTNKELLNELRALKQRVTELEQKLQAEEAKKAVAPAAAAVAPAPAGMTPDQQAEFNRVTVKAEALEDARDASGLRGIKFSGYMDPVYIYNKNQNRAGFQFLNQTAEDGYNYDNSYFGMAVLDILKETESGTQWHLALAANRGVGETFNAGNVIQEASVSVPLGDLQHRFIAGQIPDWSGYEYLPGTQNKLITHNLLFDFTLPTAYTGAGYFLIDGKWQVKAMLANMNATKRNAGEKTPAFVYRVDYSKGEFNGFGFAGVHGKAPNFRATVAGLDTNPITGEAYSTKDTSVNLFEVDGYFIRGDVTMQAQLSYGKQKQAAITADPETGELRDATWYGASILGAYKFTPQLEGIARADYIKNTKNGGGLLGYTQSDGRNGIGYGYVFDDVSGSWVAGDTEKGPQRYALSLGLGYAFNTSTSFKAEYRYDASNVANFQVTSDGSYRKNNHLLGVGTVVQF
ncbi:DUF3138 family protein [Niveibacterium umoris]|uniref:Porin n=1 Tax=Niveibacterium umoris TaxID=1193620 RepID=A0A840BE76_9RHOO|nr:DUF3138 family protein [Niveibacterium umoris]MBB4011003.1 hypothetical protein [Niveibacterium umoris]